MPPEPVPANPGWDDGPAWSRPDPLSAEEREAWLDHLVARDDPFALEEYPDPEDCVPLPGEDWLTPEELAEIREAARDLAAAFGTGMALDVMPACAELALAADAAAGDDDSYEGASDAELAGMMCAWERLEAHMAARKLAAAAELTGRPGCRRG